MDLVFIVDVSGSMLSDAKIQSLNAALEEVLPMLRREAAKVPNAVVGVRVLAFGDDARWIERQSTPLSEFEWREVCPKEGALSELGAAIDEIIAAYTLRGGAPKGPSFALLLLSDGMPTDTVLPTFVDALARLERDPALGASPRFAIGIGKDFHRPTLDLFVGPRGGGRVWVAEDAAMLGEIVHQVAQNVLRSASESAVW